MTNPTAPKRASPPKVMSMTMRSGIWVSLPTRIVAWLSAVKVSGPTRGRPGAQNGVGSSRWKRGTVNLHD